MAEYWVLLYGLRGAKEQGSLPLTAIGDSELIIRQNQRHRPPKNVRLRLLYFKVRRLADVMGVTAWVHRYRQHNRMTDKAANMAMDSTSSCQALATSTPSELLDEIVDLMRGDVDH